MFRNTFFLTFALLASVAGSSAFGQIPRYRPPAGPTMPRALDYFRRDVGVLDPYNTFVAPRRQLDRNLQMLQQQENDNARRAQQDISQLNSQIRQSTAAPTGKVGNDWNPFMNYSHYYTRSNRVGPAPRTR
jgi:hypothetical protein